MLICVPGWDEAKVKFTTSDKANRYIVRQPFGVDLIIRSRALMVPVICESAIKKTKADKPWKLPAVYQPLCSDKD